MLTIDVDLSVAVARLQGLEKQIPFAVSLAINKTAQSVKRDLVAEMRQVFDRPTPYTLDSVFIKPSSKQELQAVVGLKDDSFKGIAAVKFLTPQIAGGTRGQKRFERALIVAGVMPKGYVAVPGGSVSLDRYGNIPRKLFIELLSYFRAFPEMGYRANMSDRRRAAIHQGKAGKRGRNGKKAVRGYSYFSVGEGDKDRAPGIYKRWRNGRNLLCVVKFIPFASYSQRFEFERVARDAVERDWSGHFNDAIAYAIKTAK